MKYLSVLALLAVSACASHHDLAECKGPYLAFNPPPPPPVAAVPAKPSAKLVTK